MAEQAQNLIIGTDGVVPVYNPNGLWQIWDINVIWTGGAGANKYVPKINDYVNDPQIFQFYIVDALDEITLVPTLREIHPNNTSFALNETDILFGVGPGTQADTYRIYLDKSVLPYTLAVDERLKIGGSLANYCKIFKSSNIANDGKVISRLYDSNGAFISENIPLELLAIDSHVNYAIKGVPVCHCVDDLADGEVVVAVFYNTQGTVISKRQLLVENTAFIRSISASQKYVSGISIESAFLSPTELNTIRFPLNILLNALNLIGIVNYSDGSTLRLPVDGSKFKMFGLDQYVSTIVGQKIDLVLSYALSPDEIAYGAVVGDGKYITEPYSLITVNPNNSYTVKLFGYPKWVSEALGYTMEWYLFNLDRNVFFNVTPFVVFSENTGAFNPKGYGYLQRKSVSINLKNVSGAFQSFVHTQLVDIVLNTVPDNSPAQTAWTVSHEAVSSRPMFGDKLFAKHLATNLIEIDSGIQTEDEWLERMYLQTYPLLDRTSELTVPNPTHFIINAGGIDNEFAIGQWNQTLLISNDVTDFDTITVRFIRRTSSNDLQLSIAALLVKT